MKSLLSMYGIRRPPIRLSPDKISGAECMPKEVIAWLRNPQHKGDKLNVY